MLALTQKSNVESLIGQKIEVLEDILNQRAQRYLEMKRDGERYRGKFDIGQTVTPETLRKLGGEVLRETNDFLSIDTTHVPPVYASIFYLPRDGKYGASVALGVFSLEMLAGLTNGFTTRDLLTAGIVALTVGAGTVVYRLKEHSDSTFDSSESAMRIRQRKTVPVVGAIAHEYAHHLQQKTILGNQRRNPIAEGHARGIEGIITNRFAQRYDNPAYAFVHAKRVAEEIKDAYGVVCVQRDISPRSSLADLPIQDLRGGWDRGLWYRFSGHHYSIGVAAMAIAEALHGERVYRDVLRNDFSFLRAN